MTVSPRAIYPFLLRCPHHSSTSLLIEHSSPKPFHSHSSPFCLSSLLFSLYFAPLSPWPLSSLLLSRPGSLSTAHLSFAPRLSSQFFSLPPSSNVRSRCLRRPRLSQRSLSRFHRAAYPPPLQTSLHYRGRSSFNTSDHFSSSQGSVSLCAFIPNSMTPSPKRPRRACQRALPH
jgi:hypothetical protein